MRRSSGLGTGGTGAVRCERLEPRRMMDVTSVQVAIEPRFLEVSGKLDNDLGFSFKLHDVGGTMTVLGDGVATQVVGNKVVISGRVSEIDNLALLNSTRDSSIACRMTGAGTLPVDGFSSGGPMRLIDLSDSFLFGDVKILAAPRVILGDGNAATIDIQPSPSVRSTSIEAGTFNGSQLTSSVPMSFKADAWSGAGATFDAGVLLKFEPRVFGGDLMLHVTPQVDAILKSAHVGTIGAGHWDVRGNVGNFEADSTDINWTGNFGKIQNVKVNQLAQGTLTLQSARSFTVGGDMSGMNVTLPSSSDPRAVGIDVFSVRGDMINSSLVSPTLVRTISDGGMDSSRIFVGVSGTALPTGMADFSSSAVVQRVTVGGKDNSIGFRDSMLAAPFIRSATLVPFLVSGSPEVSTRGFDTLRVLPVLGRLFSASHVRSESQIITALRPSIIIDSQ